MIETRDGRLREFLNDEQSKNGKKRESEEMVFASLER